MYKKIIFVIFFNLILIGCSITNTGLEKYEAEYVDFFDTYTKITIYAENEKAFKKYSELFHNTMKQYNNLFDIYNEYKGINNIKTINDNAGKKPINVDSEIIELLSFGKTAYEETNGKINIALGSVLKIWHDYREYANSYPKNAKIPKVSELQNANKHTDINSIIINPDENTVYISDRETSIDVGGIAKGFAVQKAAELLKKSGVKSAILSVGGNVCAIGIPYKTDEKNTKWKIGIQNPDIENQTSNIIDTVSVSDKSVVSSGNYQRFYIVDNKMYHHIIDPSTLMPSEYFKSVSVIHDNSKIADMLSTAIFIMPYDEGKKLAEKYNADVIWVNNENEIIKNF